MIRKSFLLFIAALLSLSCIAPFAYADASPGDVIVTLGANLTPSQKDSLLKEMNVDKNNVQIVEVTNQEEHQYLDKYLPKAQIGTRAISSAKITLGQKDSGLSVSTHNINYVSNDMYMNALATAGVKDAEVYVTAPFTVSGTAGLTGLIKAYEVQTGDKIPEKNKQVANEEMVTTANLAKKDGVGKEKAAELITAIKDKIAKNPPKSDQDMQNIIQDAADQTNVKLTNDEMNQLKELFNKMKDLNLNWDQVGHQLKSLKDKFHHFANSDEGKGFFAAISAFFAKIAEFLSQLFHAIASFFQ
nr:DUF1002 domain-containing protein [Terrilactibacillus laevilacticus]